MPGPPQPIAGHASGRAARRYVQATISAAPSGVTGREPSSRPPPPSRREQRKAHAEQHRRPRAARDLPIASFEAFDDFERTVGLGPQFVHSLKLLGDAEAFADHLAAWRRRLAQGGRAVVELPTDRSRPAVQGFDGGTLSLALPPTLSAALKSLSRRAAARRWSTGRRS